MVAGGTKKAIAETLTNFASRTSMHGLGQIGRSKSIVGKTFWILAVLAFITGLIFQFREIFDRFINLKPVKTTYQIEQDTYPFPDVTICNSRFMDAGIMYSLKKQYNENPDPLYHMSKTNVSRSDPEFETWYFRFQAPYVIPYIYYNMDSNFSDAIDSMISRSVAFAVMNLSSEVLSRVTIPDWEMTMACTLGRKDCSRLKVKPLANWFYLKCLTLTTPEDVYSIAGMENGLSFISLVGSGMLPFEPSTSVITMMPGLTEANSPLSGVEALRVIIHPRGSKPLPTAEGFSIPPGYLGTIGFTVSKEVRIGEPHGQCNWRDPFLDPESNETYRSAVCIRRCIQKEIIAECGCKSLNLPDDYHGMPQNIVGCGASVKMPAQCSQFPVPRYCGENIMKAYHERICAEEVEYRIQGDRYLKKACRCYPACEGITYKTEYSLAKWPGELQVDTIWDRVIKMKVKVPEKMQGASDLKKMLYEKYFNDTHRHHTVKDLTRTLIYLSDPSLTVTTEVPSYEVMDFIADMGGTMGIWLGASLLTFCELAYLLTSILSSCYKTREIKPINTPETTKIQVINDVYMSNTLH